MRPVVPMLLVLALACTKASKEAPKIQPANAASPGAQSPGMPQTRVDSAAFHLEIGSIHERYQDLKKAADHFSQALQSAENAMQRVQAHSALGRVRDALGDKDGAIASLQQALAEMAKGKAGGPSGGPVPLMPGDEVVGRLARLFVEKREYGHAEQLCEDQLAAVREPWQREELYRIEVELYRKAGTLEKKIAEKKETLEQRAPDEAALRFLAVALADGGMMAAAMPGGRPGNQPPNIGSQVRVYEQLHRLLPDDLQFQQTLQSLYERAGRVEDAVKLVAAAAIAPRAECFGGGLATTAPPALNAVAETIRIRMRAGQKEAALAETAKLAALGAREGTSANVLAAQLYLDQAQVEQASKAIRQAVGRARTADDLRQLAFASEQVLARSGRLGELKALYVKWQKSDDPCLRMAAAQREQQGGTVASLPVPVPPPNGP